MPLQRQPFKHDKKSPAKNFSKKRDSGKPVPKREEANLTEAVTVNLAFSSMVESRHEELEVLLASIPQGHGIMDSGCTTSVVGEQAASDLASYLIRCGLPGPEKCDLPPVELRGFRGESTSTSSGLKRTVKIGNQVGTLATYVIPGATPFLISRPVLEAMGAKLDFEKRTLTAVKHDLHDVPLRQASNGHFLLPLCTPPPDIAIQQDCGVTERLEQIRSSSTEIASVEAEETNEPNLHQRCSSHAESSCEASCSRPGVKVAVEPSYERSKNPRGSDFGTFREPKVTSSDKKRAMQHILKNTKRGIVDIELYQKELHKIFGDNGKPFLHVFAAYRPRLERIPKEAQTMTFDRAVATLNETGDLHVTPWDVRIAGAMRRPVRQVSTALFAFQAESNCATLPTESAEQVDAKPPEHTCYCCNDCDLEGVSQQPFGTYSELEALYEEADWLEVQSKEVPPEATASLQKNIRPLRKINAQMILSRLAAEPEQVRSELQAWLGPQSAKLGPQVELIEVFTRKAPLSHHFEQIVKSERQTSIRLGWDYGQDFDKVYDRRMLMYLVAWCNPSNVWYSFPCSPWGPWSRFNMKRSPEIKKAILEERRVARRHLHAVSESWALQVLLGGSCHAENPLSSEAWRELHLGEVFDVRVDQCALGLRCPKTNLPVLKPTRIVTTNAALAEGLMSYRCDGKHQHAHLEGKFRGKNLSKHAETYPSKFCRVVSKLLAKCIRDKDATAVQDVLEEVFAEELDADSNMGYADSEAEDISSDSSGEQNADLDQRLTAEKARAIVRKLHVNTGHSSPQQMMRLANRCRSSEKIKKAIAQFQCSVCNELKPPPSHRKTTIPHAETPNHIVGVDFVQVELKRDGTDGKTSEIKFNVLTCVCIATDFCQQIIVPPGKGQMTKCFHEVWARPYGVPKIIYMDPDGISLSKDFQEYLAHNTFRCCIAQPSLTGSSDVLRLPTECCGEWPNVHGKQHLDHQKK